MSSSQRPQLQSISQFISEWDDPFLSLWPHRHDYIWATHPSPGSPVEWLTERRHPLSDRLIQQGSYLYGVRFGAQTSYTMLDIDIGSPYHPHRDPLAIARMIQALEPLGLIKTVAVTSSSSNGIHLYFPFEQPHSSWQIAIVIAALLENKGSPFAYSKLSYLHDLIMCQHNYKF